MTGLPIPPPHEPLSTDSKASDIWYRYWDGQSRSINDLTTSLAAVSSAVSATTSGQINSGTVQSLTSIEVVFTGIPANVRRFTLSVDQARLSSGGGLLVQLQTTTGTVNTGYLSGASRTDSTGGGLTLGTTNAFRVVTPFIISTATGLNFNMQFTRVTSHTWVGSHTGGSYNSTGQFVHHGGGTVSLGAELGGLVITNSATANNVFVAGQANIFWEF